MRRSQQKRGTAHIGPGFVGLQFNSPLCGRCRCFSLPRCLRVLVMFVCFLQLTFWVAASLANTPNSGPRMVPRTGSSIVLPKPSWAFICRFNLQTVFFKNNNKNNANRNCFAGRSAPEFWAERMAPSEVLGLAYAPEAGIGLQKVFWGCGPPFFPPPRGQQSISSICLRLLFIFPCWFQREPITTGHILIFLGALTKWTIFRGRFVVSPVFGC